MEILQCIISIISFISQLIFEFRFYSVCKVGTGYSDAELQNLQKMMEKHWRVFKPTSPPQCIQLIGTKDKPDVWIEPRQYLSFSFLYFSPLTIIFSSKILQIKAAQILTSDKYSSNFVLRFPRVMKIRLDKEWHECMDLPGIPFHLLLIIFKLIFK